MTPNRKPPRPFWLSVLASLILVSATGLVLSLLTNILLSNVYFIAATLFLVIAAVPIFTEVGGSAKASFTARREGKRPRDVLQAQEKSGKYSTGTWITFVFGTSGFICFILAFLTL